MVQDIAQDEKREFPKLIRCSRQAQGIDHVKGIRVGVIDQSYATLIYLADMAKNMSPHEDFSHLSMDKQMSRENNKVRNLRRLVEYGAKLVQFIESQFGNEHFVVDRSVFYESFIPLVYGKAIEDSLACGIDPRIRNESKKF